MGFDSIFYACLPGYARYLEVDSIHLDIFKRSSYAIW